MIVGVSGSLVTPAFLDAQILAEIERHAPESTPPMDRALRALCRWWTHATRTVGPASGSRVVLDVAVLPLLDLLGYSVLQLYPHEQGFVGVLAHGRDPVAALIATPWGGNAEEAWRSAVRAGRVAGVRWGLVCTGSHLRMVDAARPWSRRTVEFDLALALINPRGASALWALARSASLHPSPLDPSHARWSLAQIVEQSDAYGLSVCRSLGDGVIQALGAMVGDLDVRRQRRSTRSPDAAISVRDTFQQGVTVIYRLLFLLFAEARALVPVWHGVYRDAYTVEALCRRSLERPDKPGLWAALQAISRLAHAGCQAGDLVVTGFNGRLFAPRHTPLAETRRVRDEVVRTAIVSLATARTPRGRQRIAYGDLGVEQLGAVYERVLEYEPSRSPRGPLVLTRTSTERKATGSFYTPRALTEFLVRRALHPLVDGRSVDQILQLRVVDPAMGSGAFLVAACRFLAHALERAHLESGTWCGQHEAAERRRSLRRTVARHCVYGVDLNPMAVQLARLSLWLTTLASDRPLTFLDHHLAIGDSLAGARVHDLARLPFRGRRGGIDVDKRALPLFDDSVREMADRVLPERFRLARTPEHTPADVHAKERALADLQATGGPLGRWTAAADLWCAVWLWPGEEGGERTLSSGVYGDLLASLLDRQAMLPARDRSALLATAAAIAASQRFFHWELAFPEVFFGHDGRRDPEGGFDAVVGNPPWDVVRGGTLRFLRDAGTYRWQGRGHPNRYQYFVERAMQLTRRGGRIGLLVPSGLATDQGCAALRRALLDETRLDRLTGFDNRQGIFPIHRDVRFLLLTGTVGAPTDRLPCLFGCSRADVVDGWPDAAADDPPDARPIVLGRSQLQSWDPDDLTIPMAPNRVDLDIMAHAHAVAPRLDDRRSWDARFGRELNATDDRPHLVDRSTQAGRARRGEWLPVIGGKHLEPFRVNHAASACAITRADAATLLDASRTFGRPRIAYRDVASATNRLTLIAGLVPPGVVTTHTLFCLKTALPLAAQRCLLALLNSLVANYLVRLQVTTHVTTATVARLPVPPPRPTSRAFRELVRLARRLEHSGIGDEPTYARLNAIVARLYELSTTQYAHVVGTFPLLPASTRAACVAAFGGAER